MPFSPISHRVRWLLIGLLTVSTALAPSCVTSRSKRTDAAVRNTPATPVMRPGAIPEIVHTEPEPETGAIAELDLSARDEENDLALYLAGMPGAGSSTLLRLRQTSDWQEHQRRMNQLWHQFSLRHLSKIRDWRREISDVTSPGVLFYPFSGPDFVYADAIFPGGRDYVLCGLEPVKPIPSPRTLTGGENSLGLQTLYGSLTTVLNYSYFITKDMRTDFEQGRYQGILPRLYVFLARTGHTIQSVQPVSLSGKPVTWGESVPGIHIVARSGFGRKNIYYFTANLANGGSGSRVMAFTRSRGTPVTFIKSASYLLHGSGFSGVRDFILENSRAVVQDPSGVPHRFYAKGGWDITYHGNYVRTLDMFKEYYQADLAAAYRSPDSRIRSLPFGIGYVWNPGATSLIVARKSAPALP